MALSDDERAALKRLRSWLDRDMRDRRVNGHRVPGLKSLKAYYQGLQRLYQLGIAVPEELREFVTIVAWPRTYVDAIASRLRPEGFLLGGETDAELWRQWQANNMDTEIRMAIVDMLRYGRGYATAGTREDDDPIDAPLLTVESPLQMMHTWSNRHRRVTDAARFYVDESTGKRERRATLYLPNSNVYVVMGSRGWEEDPDQERDDHGLGRVMVHPLVNRAESDDRYGESEMLPVIQVTDACARALTDAQVGTEVAALPQRYAAGMTSADFKDPKTGEALTAWEAYFGSVWAAANEKAQFGQFAAGDLGNFKTIVSLYAQMAAGITGLPMRYFGQLSDNPPSADGIRADESRLIGTAEDKQDYLDDGLEGLMRDSVRLHTGADDERLLQMETYWRSAATPSLAQAADAAVKKYTAGIISLRQARRDCGYTPAQIAQMEADDAETATDPILAQILKEARANANPGAGA